MVKEANQEVEFLAGPGADGTGTPNTGNSISAADGEKKESSHNVGGGGVGASEMKEVLIKMQRMSKQISSNGSQQEFLQKTILP